MKRFSATHLGAALAELGDRETAKTHLQLAEELALKHGRFEGYDECAALLASLEGI